MSQSSWQINPTFDMIYSSFSSNLVVKPLTNWFNWVSVVQVAHGGVGDFHGESSKGSCCHLLEEQRNTKALYSTMQLILAKNHPFRQPPALFFNVTFVCISGCSQGLWRMPWTSGAGGSVTACRKSILPSVKSNLWDILRKWWGPHFNTPI